MRQAFHRVAIVNRAEPAMRLIHAVRELNHEQGSHVRTIALYTEPDRSSLFVREADQAFNLGPATFIDPATGQRKSSYLDYQRLQRALLATRADAVWVGWGFVAEHADFADLCEDLGVIFIGPTGATMRRLGDKIASKRLAEAARVPVAPWSGGPVDDLDIAREQAERIGYPLVVKATAGGGGRGIRIVRGAEELDAAFTSARSEAEKAFGDATVYLEKMVLGAHHVEVQIIADHHGTVWPVGVRDCTVQRRNQKVVEEAPAIILPATIETELCEAAVRLAREAGYHNAGTVECLYSPPERAFYFMEMNTRLQVEHPVTEETTGADMVKLQLAVARGERLCGEPPSTFGHAIEVRLNAEDPDNGFAPAPGEIELFRVPTGPGMRVDSGVETGDTVSSDFDSMIAKIVARGKDRDEAIARLRRALAECAIVIKNGASNKAFLLEVLASPEFVLNNIDTGWLDRLAGRQLTPARPFGTVALLAAAIEVYEEELALERAELLASALRGRPLVRPERGVAVELRYGGQAYMFKVRRTFGREYVIEIDGARVDVALERTGRFECWLACGGERHRILSVVNGPSYAIEVNGVAHRVTRDQGGTVRAPAPAIILSVNVEAGQELSPGDTIVVLEAMKMEMPVRAQTPARVRQVLVGANTQVAAGTPLVLVEPMELEANTTPVGKLDFQRHGQPLLPPVTPTSDPAYKYERCRHALSELRHFVLGYDLDPRRLTDLVNEAVPLIGDLPGDVDDLRSLEREVLSIVADLMTLHAQQGEGDARISAAENLITFVRSPESAEENLPKPFVDKLERAFAHYGVASLEPGPALEEALLWLFKAHTRVRDNIEPLLSLLERPRHASADISPKLRDLLDQLIDLADERLQPVSDLARQVRFRHFDHPLFEQARTEVFADLEEKLARSVAGKLAADVIINELIDCPQPVMMLLGRWLDGAKPSLIDLLLEVFVRRFYSERSLAPVTASRSRGFCFAKSQFSFNEKSTAVLATCSAEADLDRCLTTVDEQMVNLPARDDINLDLLLLRPRAKEEVESLQQALCAKLEAYPWRRSFARVCVSLVDPQAGWVTHLTFSRSPGPELREVERYRGIHPMIAGRLELWRLRNFETKRLPCTDDVYVYHGVARENPKDERIFAIVNVRDLTSVRNEAGAITSVPHLEHMFMEAVASIRDYRYRHPQKHLHWNRILLYIWPPMLLDPAELSQLINRLASSTKHLGLDKVTARVRLPDANDGRLVDTALHISVSEGQVVRIRASTPSEYPIRPLTPYTQKVATQRRRGLTYPYEIIRMLAPGSHESPALFPRGDFLEYDFDETGKLSPVQRPFGQNRANVVVGLIKNYVPRFEEDGIERVIILSDPSQGMGALAEPECARVVAAIDLAESRKIPVEWFPISSGAKISMESGTENLDWTARVLRRLVEFTEAGGEVNVVVSGINVGAQSYWNAEATMLMHTRGILIMTPAGAMVLTGKQALDYSGAISAEDHQGIGGVERIMGPNGQGQFTARDLADACQILLHHYELTYVAPGERFPRRARTRDPADRNVTSFPYPSGRGDDFEVIGDIFSTKKNPGRKKAFEIRAVMQSVIDQDGAPLERWSLWRHAETAVVWDAFLGGMPVTLLGIESKRVTRHGFVPGDGPSDWTGGTLFPQSSKKVARAINSASGRRPVVMLANLSGFDGSPESMRKLQLEYGAEIGRAVVKFDGPIIFNVISRYHGGAYVVFSRTLNENLETSAIEGAFASVIGGAPAAAVVFAREVKARAYADPRIRKLQAKIEASDDEKKPHLYAQLNEQFQTVYNEALGKFAEEFDRVHSVNRAKEVGSLQHIITAQDLRPYLIAAVERGIAKFQERAGGPGKISRK